MKRLIPAVLIMAALFAPLVAAARPAHAATIPGDVNGDCVVTAVDIMLVAQRFGYAYGSLRYSPIYDLNNDHRISTVDIQMVAVRFGDHC